MKKYSLGIFSLLFISFLSFFSSCVDEDLVDKSESQLTSIKLSFAAPEVETVLTKGIGGKKYIQKIDLFIFEQNGDFYEHRAYDINSDANTGTIEDNITVKTGPHYVYALANATGSSFAEVDNLENVSNLKAFKNKIASLNGTLDLTGVVVPMTGTLEGANDDGLISISKDASYTIKLERIVSSIKFDVSCTSSGATFELKSYKVVNVPQTMTLWQKNVSTSTNSWSGGTVSTSDNKYGFEFYMFENIYNNSNVQSYDDREKKSDPEAVGDIIYFENAPNATYVVLNGHYTGLETVGGVSQNVSADVSYYVHLGNTNDSYGNFETLRNKEYIYTVQIKSISKLVTEVEVKDKPYDRGDGTIGLVGNTYDLDAHYEFFNITIPVSENNTYEAQEGVSSTTNFGWYSFRIFDDSKSGYTMPALEPGKTNRWTSVMVYMKEGDNDYNQALIHNIDDLNAALDKCYGNDMSEVTLTCFVNENIGDDYRESVVFRERLSGNGSSILKDGVRLRQNYMRKFFDNGGKGYAWEVLNETGPLKGDQWIGNSGDDNFNGWKNTRSVVIGGEQNASAAWPSKEEMMKFQKACMSRNRDENGDGQISDDELKWYLPAINQYVGAWMGAAALKEARLYTSDVMEYLHYVSSTGSGKSSQILWSEEGSANGAISGDYTGGYDKQNGNHYWNVDMQLRCIRNFGHDDNPTAEPTRYYSKSSSGDVLDFYLTDGYRNPEPSGELDFEDGHLGGNNKLYRSLKVGPVKGPTTFKVQKEFLKQNKSICKLKDGYYYAEYSDYEFFGGWVYKGYAYFKKVKRGYYSMEENGNFLGYNTKIYGYSKLSNSEIKQAYDENSRWRLPNQRELSMLMAEGFLTGGNDYISRTISSFTYSDRGGTRGFMGNSSMVYLSNSSDEFNNAARYVRCVQDNY